MPQPLFLMEIKRKNDDKPSKKRKHDDKPNTNSKHQKTGGYVVYCSKCSKLNINFKDASSHEDVVSCRACSKPIDTARCSRMEYVKLSSKDDFCLPIGLCTEKVKNMEEMKAKNMELAQTFIEKFYTLNK